MLSYGTWQEILPTTEYSKAHHERVLKERCDREMAAALLLVLFKKIRGWDHNPRQLNNQQRGQHRRVPQVGKSAWRARRPGGSELPASEKNAPWAALAGCIMPPNLLGHTTSSLHVRQAAVAGVASSRDPFHEL